MTVSASLHVVIVGSAPVIPEELQSLCAGADILICADGGGDAALLAGLTPDLVLGDMDSLSSAGRLRLAEAGVRFIEHPPDKDKTDTELALDYALQYRPARITITGVLGGKRLDHTLGNLLLLTLPMLHGVDVRMVDASTDAFAVWSYGALRGSVGDYVSLLPVTERVEGVRTEGLRYPLYDEPLLRGYTRGVSNELLAESATVRVAAGCLLVVHERG